MNKENCSKAMFEMLLETPSGKTISPEIKAAMHSDLYYRFRILSILNRYNVTPQEFADYFNALMKRCNFDS